MKDSFVIVGVFIVGLLSSYYGILYELLLNDNFSTYILYLLMFIVGISIGADKESLSILRKANWKIVLIPLSVIIGSLGSVAIYALITQSISVKEAMAVGAGFGYYSLSSIMISELHSDSLGTIALISNIVRELITLLFAPLLMIIFGKLAPVVSGGATAMDSTLPIIIKTSGKEYGILAIFSGIVLTVLVPFIISVIFA